MTTQTQIYSTPACQKSIFCYRGAWGTICAYYMSVKSQPLSEAIRLRSGGRGVGGHSSTVVVSAGGAAAAGAGGVQSRKGGVGMLRAARYSASELAVVAAMGTNSERQ